VSRSPIPSAIIVRRFHVRLDIRIPALNRESDLNAGPNRLRPFDGKDERDAPRAEDRVELRPCVRNAHMGRVHGRDVVRLLDHQEAAPQRTFAHVLLLGADRQNLQAHTAVRQLLEPEVPERVIVAALP